MEKIQTTQSRLERRVEGNSTVSNTNNFIKGRTYGEDTNNIIQTGGKGGGDIIFCQKTKKSKTGRAFGEDI